MSNTNQTRFYAKHCCGQHKHTTIEEALACTNVESPNGCGGSPWRGHEVADAERGDAVCLATAHWGKCEGVKALVWAFGDFTFVGLHSNESNRLSQLTNPAWWDKHRPGWREKVSAAEGSLPTKTG